MDITFEALKRDLGEAAAGARDDWRRGEWARVAKFGIMALVIVVLSPYILLRLAFNAAKR